MSQYYMLLKNGMVDFEKLLIEKYSFIGLDEVETIFLIKLKKIFDSNAVISETVIVDELVKVMSINKTQIIELLIKLINGQFISLKIVNNKETYSLDDTYKRLVSLLDEDNFLDELKQNESELKKTVSFIEKELEKLISPTELEVIKHWIDVDKYTFSQVKNTVKPNNTQTKENLQEIFNSVYGKLK